MVTLHLCAVAFWFGVLGCEFVIERSRAESSAHGFGVARNHYWIDLFLEVPAALLVLVTGALVARATPITPLLAVKLTAGTLAVLVNVYCVVPVARRRAAADAGQLDEVIRQSRIIDRIGAIGVPAGLVALVLGLMRV